MNDGGKPLVLVNGVRREGGLSSVSPEDILSVDVTQTASAEFMREGYTSVVNIKTKKTDWKYTAFNGGINSHSPCAMELPMLHTKQGIANILCT